MSRQNVYLRESGSEDSATSGNTIVPSIRGGDFDVGDNSSRESLNNSSRGTPRTAKLNDTEKPIVTLPTPVPFIIVPNKPRMAQAQIFLSNLSDKIIRFKLKSSQENQITSYPSGSGSIPPRETYKCNLTWQVPKNLKQSLQKRMLLITSVSDTNEQIKTTSTRLMACLDVNDDGKARDKRQVFLLDTHGKGHSVKEDITDLAVVHKKSVQIEPTQYDNKAHMSRMHVDFIEYLPPAAIGITILVIICMAYFFNRLNYI